MTSRNSLVAALLTLATQLVSASGPFKFCTDNKCGSCPVQITDAGTGYPNCVVYSTDDVFNGNSGFAGSVSGGFAPFLDVPAQGEGCKIIVKSPAGTDKALCGQPIAEYSNPVCGTLQLDKTFMVQYCCGQGDCSAAIGSKRSAKFGDMYLDGRSGGGGGAYLYHANGSRIEPLFEGPVGTDTIQEKKGIEVAGRAPSSRSQAPSESPAKRDNSNCPSSFTSKKRDLMESQSHMMSKRCSLDKGSWQSDGADYTRPSDNSTIVHDSVNGGNGGGTVTISTTRSQTWTTSVSMDFGFADVISLGLSFSQDYSCEVSDSTSYAFSIPAGETGMVGFTAFLDCQTGTYSCGGTRSDKVEICAPYKYRNSGEIAGSYSVIATS